MSQDYDPKHVLTSLDDKNTWITKYKRSGAWLPRDTQRIQK